MKRIRDIVGIIVVFMFIIFFPVNSLTNIEIMAVIGKAIIGMSMIN